MAVSAFDPDGYGTLTDMYRDRNGHSPHLLSWEDGWAKPPAVCAAPFWPHKGQDQNTIPRRSLSISTLLTNYGRDAILNTERALLQAVQPSNLVKILKALKPSLGRVAVSAFNPDGYGILTDMYRDRNGHMPHLLC